MAIPVPIFPRKSDIALAKNGKLNDAVVKAVSDDVAVRKGPPANFAITIVDPDGFAMGGFSSDHEFYTGSLIKVGVLYAAWAMLDMVRRFVALRSPKSADDLFKQLRAEIDGAIERSAKLISGAEPKARLPSYKDVFTVTRLGGKLQVDLSWTYKQNLKLMIVNSDNDAAGSCIHGLGFAYLNGALEQGGFFDSATKKGVWAAGDFKHGWNPVRIPCDNLADGTAQGATTEALARLVAVIVLGDVLDDHSHVEMNKLLKQAAHGPDPSFLLRKEVDNHLKDDQVTHAKIGIGHDPHVYSEVALVKGVGLKADKTYIVAWQNIDWKSYWTWDIITIMKNSIAMYES